MLNDMTADELVALIRNPDMRSPSVVNEYYTRCIPHYRAMLGNHWHTGYYREDGRPIGQKDQLRMEQVLARSSGIDQSCRVLDVGCGIGGTACHLAGLTGARFGCGC